MHSSIKQNLSFKGSVTKELSKVTIKNAFPETIKGLKDGRVSKVDALAFSTMGISSIGYLVGGTGLIQDFMVSKNKKELTKNNVGSFFIERKKPNTNNTFTPFAPKNKIKVIAPIKKPLEKKERGCDTIKPKTKFGKIGMNFARMAVTVAGVAGVFNGISMNLPLLAVGEGVTTLSAPIIETPVGTGIFGLGLAVINLARVLDSDPKFKINREEFKKANTKGKAKLLKKNFAVTFGELFKSGKEVAQNTGKLFTKKTKEAQNFFKEKFFSFKPATVVIQEKVDKAGKLIIDKIPQANPHLMHTAALGLSAASLLLITGNLIKSATTEKVALRAYAASNATDNVALSKWGVEKMSSATSTTGKTTGGAFAVAGASILAGQAGIDKNWGRGLMWEGIGLIMAGFTIERGAMIAKSLKKITPPTIKRQWKINLNEAMRGEKINKESLNNFYKKIENKLGTKFNENDSEVKKTIESIGKKNTIEKVAI